MAQYIDKDALVAEIEKLKEQDYPCDTFEESIGYYNAIGEIENLLSTLEVKEVNLTKEIAHFALNGGTGDNTPTIGEIAKHFFELGLKAQKGE